ncbi:DUF3108 domain-containing protein [Piscinibacter sakaiensis]|uniref:DUF3108 domain-containing protein n=1 Tax=Piscinibacter sakaiensis TaxID=1547922 RepID=UPI003AB04489
MLPGKSPQSLSTPTSRRPRPTLRVFALAALLALLLHGLVLGRLPAMTAYAGDKTMPQPMRVRAIAPVAAGAAPLPVVAPAPPPAPAKTQAAAANVLVAAAPVIAAVELAEPPLMQPADEEVAAPAAAEPPLPPAEPLLVAEAAPPADEPLQLAALGNEPPLPLDDVIGLDMADGDPIPIYSTRFPPSQTLRYDLQRGVVSGTGELNWRHDGTAYELQLLARISGLTILTQLSKGGFDKAGLAPVRFTDQRLRSAARAANFQRKRQLITFSGPSTEYPMVRGVQDRLSWMMQVPAILAANPRLASAGQKITLYVVGARGDASVWDFRFEGSERLATRSGEVQTVKFSRQPRKEFDTKAEVWLDPARDFLPLRARLGNPEEGAMLELRRID